MCRFAYHTFRARQMPRYAILISVDNPQPTGAPMISPMISPIEQSQAISLALLAQKMDAITEDHKQATVERRETSIQIQNLNRGHDQLISTLNALNKQLMDFILASTKTTAESSQEIRLVDARLVIVERDLDHRRTQEKADSQARAERVTLEDKERAKFYGRLKLFFAFLGAAQICWDLWGRQLLK